MNWQDAVPDCHLLPQMSTYLPVIVSPDDVQGRLPVPPTQTEIKASDCEHRQRKCTAPPKWVMIYVKWFWSSADRRIGLHVKFPAKEQLIANFAHDCHHKPQPSPPQTGKRDWDPQFWVLKPFIYAPDPSDKLFPRSHGSRHPCDCGQPGGSTERWSGAVEEADLCPMWPLVGCNPTRSNSLNYYRCFQTPTSQQEFSISEKIFLCEN